MRIVIASTYVPFIKGGGTMLVESLHQALKARGHVVDSVYIPFRSYWPEIPQQTLALRCLDLTMASGQRIDLLITSRSPSYAIPHDNKVSWFIHHHRGAYDLWGTPFQDIPNTSEGRHAREAMIASDNLYLREHRKIYPISSALVERLRKFNQIEANGVLLTPLPHPEPYHDGDQRDYFVYSARLTPGKRQSLIIEALRYVRSPFKVIFIGKADVPTYEQEIQQMIRKFGVEDKIILKGWMSEEEKADLTSNALAGLYPAFAEDGCGYSTLEAFHAHRPVITCTDSGGTLDVITHEKNGLVVDPVPERLAEAMDQLWLNKSRTAALGQQAFETLREKGINWDNVVEGLTT
jgi:glycosyltransferase involved in cell wall biosynthesis